jgi:shikimate dehydrogenase
VTHHITTTIPTLCGSIAAKASPFGVALHEAGYKALGMDWRYVAIATDDLRATVASCRTLQFRGLGISMPFKLPILQFVDEVSDDVREIGACNTVVSVDGRFHAHNTDWSGALDALKEASALDGSRAVIIGAGGVARAIAWGLKKSGYAVTIAARNLDAARSLVNDLALDGVVAIDRQGDANADLIVNATPWAESGGPVDLDRHPRATALLDVIGHRKTTPLVQLARDRGLRVAAGWRMRFHQGRRQFEMYTGRTAPVDVMSAALESKLPD